MNMNEMTDIEMADFVTSGEENCAGKNRKVEDQKQSDLRLRKHREQQEGDENEKEENYDDDSVVGTGNGPTGSKHTTLGSSEDNTLEDDEEEEDDIKPKKKKRIRPKKKCPYCGVMKSNMSRHCKVFHGKKYHGKGDFKCNLCNKRLTSRNGLVRHLRGKFHADQTIAQKMAYSMDRRRKNVPIVEMQRVRSRPNEAMGTGMGFERRAIDGLRLRRRLQSGNEMYGSSENLIVDLTQSSDSDSDSDEIGGTTMAISCVPTNVKRPGNEGQQDTAPANEHPIDAEMSMPEDVTPSMEARIRVLQEENSCKICLDQPAEVVFVSCRHLCSCTECAKALRKCPIFRAKIEQSMRTYRS